MGKSRLFSVTLLWTLVLFGTLAGWLSPRVPVSTPISARNQEIFSTGTTRPTTSSPSQPTLLLELPRTELIGERETKAVNIYIFCAKDTLDESRWHYLSKSLHRVSSTTDGKYGAIQEIEVEGVSYLPTTSETKRCVENQILENVACNELIAEQLKLPHSGLPQDMQVLDNEVSEKVVGKFEKQSEPVRNSSQTEDLHIKADIVSDFQMQKGCVLESTIEENASEVEVGIPGRVSSSCKLEEASKEKVEEAGENFSSQVDSLRFEENASKHKASLVENPHPHHRMGSTGYPALAQSLTEALVEKMSQCLIDLIFG